MRIILNVFLKIGEIIVVVFYPLYTFAQTQPSIRIFDRPSKTLTFTTLANKFGGIVNTIIPFLIAVAVFLVLWGIFKYISAAGDSEKLAEGKKVALYGIFAIFMMLAFWGLVVVVKKSLFG